MNLTDENYFTKEMNMKYAGSSQIKSFVDCEARTMAELKEEWKQEMSTALLVGSYVDNAISGTLDIFKAQHPEILKKDGTLKAEYLQAEYILSRIERDELFKKYISGDHQTIMTGEIAGVPIKIKIDSYFPNKAIVDMKVVKDFAPVWDNASGQKENFVDYWKYTWQGALYQEIVRQNTGKKLPFFIAAVTKEKEPDLAVMAIPQEVLDIKLEVIKSVLPRIKELKEGKAEPHNCGKCDFCKFHKKLDKIIDYRDLNIG